MLITTPVASTDLNARVHTLETSLKRQRRLTMTLGGAMIALTTLAAADKVGALRATNFELEDRQGKVRATLALDEAGSPTLTFMTAEGIVTRAIGPHDETPARIAELERVINTIPRVQPQAVTASDTTYRLADLEQESSRQREQLAEQQRLAAQAQDALRLEQDQRRREQERWEVQRRNERFPAP